MDGKWSNGSRAITMGRTFTYGSLKGSLYIKRPAKLIETFAKKVKIGVNVSYVLLTVRLPFVRPYPRSL